MTTSLPVGWKTIVHGGINVPLTPQEKFVAFDGDGRLWAYKVAPRWSSASRKWIPQNGDTPRHIVTLFDSQVNTYLSIADE